jgi:hypothetical protein
MHEQLGDATAGLRVSHHHAASPNRVEALDRPLRLSTLFDAFPSYNDLGAFPNDAPRPFTRPIQVEGAQQAAAARGLPRRCRHSSIKVPPCRMANELAIYAAVAGLARLGAYSAITAIISGCKSAAPRH